MSDNDDQMTFDDVAIAYRIIRDTEPRSAKVIWKRLKDQFPNKDAKELEAIIRRLM